MADIHAIHAVGEFIIDYLRQSYPPVGLVDPPQCQFQLLSTGKLATVDEDDLNTTLSLLLHRVTINEYLRNSTRVNGGSDRSLPLSIDLHYLMTVWAPDALAENLILAWAMQRMHQHPVLDGALLPDANWGSGEVIQISPTDLNRLAAMVDLVGGHIRNAVLSANVIAQGEGRSITFEDVVRGLAGEYRKLGRQLPQELRS